MRMQRRQLVAVVAALAVSVVVQYGMRWWSRINELQSFFTLDDAIRQRNEVFVNRVSPFLVTKEPSTVSRIHLEAFVHPALLTHGQAKNVLILGENEGRIVSILTQIVKHKSVESVTVVSIDHAGGNENQVPEKFSMNKNSIRVRYRDMTWLIEWNPEHDESFDVVLWDRGHHGTGHDLDLQISSLDRVIERKNGIMAVHCGPSFQRSDVVRETETYKNSSRLIDAVSMQMNFEHVQDYNEPLVSGGMPVMFLVAFRSFKSKSIWMRNEALHALALKKQVGPGSSFENFDGYTMVSIQRPTRISEEAFCRRFPTDECRHGHGFDRKIPSIPESLLEVKRSTFGEHAGRGVYAKEDIKKDTYIMLDRLVHYVYAPPATYRLIATTIKKEIKVFSATNYDILGYYLHDYGLMFYYWGDYESFVDPNLLTFRNHGCNGTVNLGILSNVTEFTADLHIMPDKLQGRLTGPHQVYNPFFERNMPYVHTIRPARDIKKGEELLANYMSFVSSIEFWEEDLGSLRLQCSGSAGPVEEYQKYKLAQ